MFIRFVARLLAVVPLAAEELVDGRCSTAPHES